VAGRVTVGRNAWFGAMSVARADGHIVQIGDDFHLGPRSTVHIAHEIFPCIIGDRVTVGENSCVHACTVGNDIVVGDNTTILDGSVVEDQVVLEPNSLVFPGTRLAGGFLYAGMPAKPVRPLTPDEVKEYAAAIRGRPDMTDLPPQPAIDRSHMHASVFIAATASVAGRVVAAEGSSVFFSNVLDAGRATIEIGAQTNIQDNTVIRCSGDGFRIGRESTIGHNVLLHDCTIGDHSLIGIGSTVAKGTVVGDRVLLAAGARTEEGQVLEDGFLYVGAPARKRVPLDAAKQKMVASTIWTYCHYSQVFKAAQNGEPGPAPLKAAAAR
jgi:carbonic anhydrase/acetyltransferase-like protein (isoleucine patch superfamily)